MSFAKLTAKVLLSLLLAVPGLAQLAPGSAWKASSADFLNLYQATTASTVNPEILMVIDQSGSASRLMFHPLFPNNWNDENPPNNVASTESIDYSILISNASWPTSGKLNSSLNVGFASDYSQKTFVSYVQASGHKYYIGGSRNTVVVGSVTYPYNTLIKPDGSEVTAADVTLAGGNLNNAVAWMMCASHVRLRLTKIDSTTLAVPRDIDFPLFWKPIDEGATVSAISGFKNGNANVGGLKVAAAVDPLNPTTPVNIDTDENTTNPTLFSTANSKTVNIYGGRALSNCYAVRSRYIEWVFVGKDPSSPSGAYYCIPNAIPSPVSNNFTVQRSINPASISYNGASDTFSWTYSTEATTGRDLSKGWYPAFTNKLPNRNRLQSIKEATIKSWLKYQGSIFFAWRQLYDSGTTPSNTISTTNPNQWAYLNSSADLAAIADLRPGGETPLVESFLNAYCQMTRPDAFKAMISAKKYTADKLECMHHFVIVLTDGAPGSIPSGSESTCSFPYLQTARPSGCTGYTAGSSPAYSGNAAIKANASALTGSYWNAPTLAGIAAHGGDGSTSSTTWIRDPKLATDSGNLNVVNGTSGGWLPFWVTSRYPYGATSASTLTHAQPIQTMTVGVSLGVGFLTATNTDWSTGTNGAPTVKTTRKLIQNDITGSKFRLMAAALLGDPTVTNYDITNASPFYLSPGTSNKASDASYFFDGRDPATLVNNLDDAINQVLQLSGVSSTAAPVFPSVGAGLGNSVYISKFEPPVNPGPLWTGDLKMFPTKSTAAGTLLVDSSGATITGSLENAIPQWSAAAALAARGWLNRVIYTRPPSTNANWNTDLVRVNLGTNGTNTSDLGYQAIVPYLSPSGNAALQLKNWQFFVGADVGTGGSPLTTRSDTIMGDIIDSAPTVLQYSTLPSSVTTASPKLAAAWTAHGPVSGTSDKTGSFRVIFVGTNQGFLHAFGEVNWVDSTSAPGTRIIKGVVDELWAFAPTELLPNIDQLQVSSNKHYYAVDGQPTVYLLDLPQTINQATGNSIFDVGATNSERAVVIFGMGKGGRSYYAINVADPCAPAMKWALCPNEQYNYPGTRFKAGSSSVVAKMGLATTLPTLARVATSKESITNQVVDAVLIGGGYSDWQIEGALPSTAVAHALASYPVQGTNLGRSALAIDVDNGLILNTWDTSGTSTAGPVIAGVVPVEIDQGSGMTARGYFTDYYGSLWAIGGTAMEASPRNMFRVDTVVVDNWNARQVYNQAVPLDGSTAGNGVCTTLPSPFLLSYFPVARTTAPLEQPFALGIAFSTGDRNNPLDKYTYTKWTAPTQHRVNVVFDRQDINSVISASGLTTAVGIDTNPTSSTYFLKANYGYFINFPAPSGGFVPKGITSPLLLDNNIFYSYFNPTTASCAGGTGTTSTYQVCNVMVPIANAGNASSATAVNGCKSGLALSWTGVASSLAARNLITGVQAGLSSGSGTTNDPTAVQNLTLQNLNTQSSDRYPKIRVWRVVH